MDNLPALFDDNGMEVEGPRYCPSIEKKLQKFPDRDRHQVWLEREGLNSHLVYPNGLATGLPYDAQLEMIKLVPGLENARVLAPAYIVDYDFIEPQKVL